MKVRILALVVPLLGALALAASARDDEKDKPKATVYKTPQEVFDAFIPALNKRDTKTFVGCLAPEVIKKMAGDAARRGIERRIFAQTGGKDGGVNDKLMKSWKGTFDVLDKHGLTAEATKKIKADDRQKAEAALVKLIKDHAAFLVDYQEAMDKQEGSKPKESEVKAKLGDVKIDGDRATGTVTITNKDNEEKQTFAFVKVGDGWKIDPFNVSGKDRKPAKDK
jgi:hypothetical protein